MRVGACEQLIYDGAGHAQLQQSSWALVRHNNVEKKKFLFRADRLRAYSSAPDWSQEGAMASALEAVDGCLSLLSFLEMVVPLPTYLVSMLLP